MRYFYARLINIKYLEKYKGGRLKKNVQLKKKILFSLVSEVSYNSITCFRHNGKLSTRILQDRLSG